MEETSNRGNPAAPRNPLQEMLGSLCKSRLGAADQENAVLVHPGAPFNEAGWWFSEICGPGYPKLFKDCDRAELLEVVQVMHYELSEVERKMQALQRALDLEKQLNASIMNPALSLL